MGGRLAGAVDEGWGNVAPDGGGGGDVLVAEATAQGVAKAATGGEGEALQVREGDEQPTGRQDFQDSIEKAVLKVWGERGEGQAGDDAVASLVAMFREVFLGASGAVVPNLGGWAAAAGGGSKIGAGLDGEESRGVRDAPEDFGGKDAGAGTEFDRHLSGGQLGRGAYAIGEGGGAGPDGADGGWRCDELAEELGDGHGVLRRW